MLENNYISGMVSIFSKYYMDDGCLLLNDTFPYMVIDGHLQWNLVCERGSNAKYCSFGAEAGMFERIGTAKL